VTEAYLPSIKEQTENAQEEVQAKAIAENAEAGSFLDLLSANFMDNPAVAYVRTSSLAQRVSNVASGHAEDRWANLPYLKTFTRPILNWAASVYQTKEENAKTRAEAQYIKSQHGWVANTAASVLADPTNYFGVLAAGAAGKALVKSGLKLGRNIIARNAVEGATMNAVTSTVDKTFETLNSPNAKEGEEVGPSVLGSTTAGLVLGGALGAVGQGAAMLVKRGAQKFKANANFERTFYQMPENEAVQTVEISNAKLGIQQTLEIPPKVDVSPSSKLQKVLDETPDVFIANTGGLLEAHQGMSKVASGLSFGIMKEGDLLTAPDVRAATSNYQTVRKLGQNLFPYSFRLMNEEGQRVAQVPPVEMLAEANETAITHDFGEKFLTIFKTYADEKGLSKVARGTKSAIGIPDKEYSEFCKQVMRTIVGGGEQNTNQHVIKAAQLFNDSIASVVQDGLDANAFSLREEIVKEIHKEVKDVVGKLKKAKTQEEHNELMGLYNDAISRLKAAKEERLTPASFKGSHDEHYYPRMYNQNWIMNHPKESKEAIASAFRSTGSDAVEEQVEATYKTLAHLDYISDDPFKRMGDEGYKIVNVEDQFGRRRNELKRTIDVPTIHLAELLNNDVVDVFNRFTHTISADAALGKRFGSADVRYAIDLLDKEYASKVKAINTKGLSEKDLNKALVKNNKEYQDAKELVELMYARIRGVSTYNVGEGARKFWGTIKDIKTASTMGNLPFAALMDTFSATLHLGAGRVLKGTVERLKPNFLFKRKFEADAFATATESFDIGRFFDYEHALTRDNFNAEKFWQGGVPWIAHRLAGITIKATGARQLDGFTKGIIGRAGEHEILALCKKGKLGLSDTNFLRDCGISEEAQKLIKEQFTKYGSATSSGFKSWDNDFAKESLVAAVRKLRDECVITPTGGSIPKWFDHPFGSAMLQFKRCMFAAHSKAFIPMTQTLVNDGVAAFMGVYTLGLTAAYMREVAKDRSAGVFKTRTYDERISSAFTSLDMFAQYSFFHELGSVLCFNEAKTYTPAFPDYTVKKLGRRNTAYDVMRNLGNQFVPFSLIGNVSKAIEAFQRGKINY
ncbi:MAG: hypothetical protein MJ007_07505, partial [Paludibacteraceae bacterium]|nr:hypothetical protein [Paludibacteraceae bacterium]